MPRRPAEVKAFVAAITSDPDDATAKLAFADWLEERGDAETAAALRWMVRHNKYPAPTAGGWRWFRRNIDGGYTRTAPRMPWSFSCLPEIVGRELGRRYPTVSRDFFVMVKRLGWALARIRELVD